MGRLGNYCFVKVSYVFIVLRVFLEDVRFLMV